MPRLENKNMNKYYTYKHLKKGTDIVFYIGKGSGNRAFSKKKRSKWWNNTVDKYDYDIIIIEENISNDAANKLEIELIKQYGRRDKGLGELVNMTDGGDGGDTLSNHPNREAILKQMSIDRIGKSAIWNIGRVCSEETKKKLSEVWKGRKQSKTHIENRSNSKKLLFLNELTGEYFFGWEAAANSQNIHKDTLRKRIGKNKGNIKLIGKNEK